MCQGFTRFALCTLLINFEYTRKEQDIEALYLKKFRKKMKLTQKEFAASCQLSLDTLKSYESGRRALSLEKYREIKSHFGYLQRADSNAIEVMIDYLRITFKSIRDLRYFSERYLFCDFKEFQSFETKLMNYNHLWKRGDIWLFDYFDKHETDNYQVSLQLSGRGCRQMELVFENRGFTWYDFLLQLSQDFPDMNVTRIDLAVDELYKGMGREDEQIELSDLIAKYYKRELQSEDIQKWNHIGGGSLHFETEEDIEANRDGISLYFGSRQSQMYFNFYEKRFELARSERISVEEALEIFGIWNRYELRFSDKKANSIVEEYLFGVDLAEIARGIINAKLQVYDGVNDYGAYMADLKWQRLFGGTEPLKLKTSPEAYNIDRTIKWLLYQVSNSLALVDEYDKLVNEQYLKMILESGEINDRGEQMLSDVRASLSKVVA